jgi:AraC family transcriptional regulator
MTAPSTAVVRRPIAPPLAVVRRRTRAVDQVRSESVVPPDLHTAAVGKALAFMREHLAEVQGLSDHARAASLSPYHFHRVFKNVTGVTPGRFLTSLRLAEAKRLLLCSTMSATYIGQSVGYLSSGTFTTQFTRLVGLPPRKFRVAGRALGGVPVADVLGQHLRDGPNRPGCVTVRVGPRPGEDPGWVALAAFRMAVPQERPIACAGVMAGDTVTLSGLDGARFLLAFSLPPSGTVRQVLTASCDTHGLYVAHADLPALPGVAEVHVELRRPTPFDPPLLLAVPLLWR